VYGWLPWLVQARVEDIRATPYDLVQASEYYLTPRAAHPNAKNKHLTSKSLLPLLMLWLNE
jgi:hypothetical protein